VAIVEGYRTATFTVPGPPERTLSVPVPGETTVVPVRAIVELLRESGLSRFLEE
jgi:hypothetical protein